MSNSRRRFLGGTAATAAFGALGALGAGALVPGESAHAANRNGGSDLGFHADGTYDTVPLEKPVLTLGMIQSRVHSFEASQSKRMLKSNLEHMLSMIDSAFYYGPRPDLLMFHEFPLQGWRKWNRKEAHALAIEIPGEETEALSKKAREHNTWIAFGAYVRDKDWPGHVLSVTSLISNTGEVVAKHWKVRNIKGAFSDFELFTTTTYDVLDQYIEMYGRDAVIPVARTPLGNFSMSPTQREPELFRASAMKGAEIFLRTVTGGAGSILQDAAATSLYNGTYTAVVNNSISPDNGPFLDDPGGGAGGTTLFGPDGKVVVAANGKYEQMVVARIPIAAMRERHRQPVVHMELYNDIFNAYRNEYPPNLWTKYLPDSLEDAGRYVKDKSRWK